MVLGGKLVKHPLKLPGNLLHVHYKLRHLKNWFSAFKGTSDYPLLLYLFTDSFLTPRSYLKALWLLLEPSVCPGSGIMPQGEGFKA